METQLDILKRKDDGIDLQLMIDWRLERWDGYRPTAEEDEESMISEWLRSRAIEENAFVFWCGSQLMWF